MVDEEKLRDDLCDHSPITCFLVHDEEISSRDRVHHLVRVLKKREARGFAHRGEHAKEFDELQLR